ncbi:MAG: hypothetical protein MMC33_008608 [Icmadophila ericetorum]|nr:hypothetical protein [Icmadophila ericetorum]
MVKYTWTEAEGLIALPRPSTGDKAQPSHFSSAFPSSSNPSKLVLKPPTPASQPVKPMPHPSKPLIYLQSRKIPEELRSPYTRPLYYPHVVDLSCFDHETETHTVTLADAIVTIIFYHSPEALTNFVNTKDHRISTFRLIIPEGKHRGYFAIGRKENEIMCGYKDHKNYPSGEQVTLAMDPTGVWKPIAIDALRAVGTDEGITVLSGRARELAIKILRMQFWKCAPMFTYEVYPKLKESFQHQGSMQTANW